MKIVDLTPDAPEIEQVAELLMEGFRDTGSASWRTLAEALEEIVGVIPDANGFGKPDILMAKRIGHP